MAESMETGVKKVHISSTAGQVPQQMMSQFTPQDKVTSAYNVALGSSANVYVADLDGFAKVAVITNASASHDYVLTASYSPDGNLGIQTAASTKTGVSYSKWTPFLDAVTNYLIIQITNNDTVARTYDTWVKKLN
jgi:hypothetical protein